MATESSCPEWMNMFGVDRIWDSIFTEQVFALEPFGTPLDTSTKIDLIRKIQPDSILISYGTDEDEVRKLKRALPEFEFEDLTF